MPKTGAKTKRAQRAALVEIRKEIQDGLKAQGIKTNPGLIMAALAFLAPKIVKAALIYFGLKLGYRVADATVDWVSGQVRKGMGLEEQPKPTKAK